MRRYAENTQLYQVVSIDEAAMRHESWTVSGQPYDAFTIERDPRGAKRLLDAKETLPARRCPHEQTRGGRRDRCWDGTEG